MMPQELIDTRVVKTPPDERMVETPSGSSCDDHEQGETAASSQSGKWVEVSPEELAEMAETLDEFGMHDAV